MINSILSKFLNIFYHELILETGRKSTKQSKRCRVILVRGQFLKASGIQGHIRENKKQGMLSGNVYTKFQVFEVFGLVRGRTERHTQTDIYERKYNKPINACVTGILYAFCVD